MTHELVPVSVVSVTEDWVPVLVDLYLPPVACHAGQVALSQCEPFFGGESVEIVGAEYDAVAADGYTVRVGAH